MIEQRGRLEASLRRVAHDHGTAVLDDPATLRGLLLAGSSSDAERHDIESFVATLAAVDKSLLGPEPLTATAERLQAAAGITYPDVSWIVQVLRSVASAQPAMAPATPSPSATSTADTAWYHEASPRERPSAIRKSRREPQEHRDPVDPPAALACALNEDDAYHANPIARGRSLVVAGFVVLAGLGVVATVSAITARSELADQRDAAAERERRLQSDIDSALTELGSMDAELDTARTELSSVKSTLAAANSDLASMSADLASLTDERDFTQSVLQAMSTPFAAELPAIHPRLNVTLSGTPTGTSCNLSSGCGADYFGGFVSMDASGQLAFEVLGYVIVPLAATGTLTWSGEAPVADERRFTCNGEPDETFLAITLTGTALTADPEDRTVVVSAFDATYSIFSPADANCRESHDNFTVTLT